LPKKQRGSSITILKIREKNRFSGADLSILIRDAAFEPLRKCENTTTFLKTEEGYTPIYPSYQEEHPEAEIYEGPYSSIPGKKLKLADVCYVR